MALALKCARAFNDAREKTSLLSIIFEGEINVPCTSTRAALRAFPSALEAITVYFPASVFFTWSIVREIVPSGDSVSLIRPSSSTSSPSFCLKCTKGSFNGSFILTSRNQQKIPHYLSSKRIGALFIKQVR
ncbi:UNVERIFIED_CONTAM: hypothetical protein NCL1_14440 [Trichonephila clavipes]